MKFTRTRLLVVLVIAISMPLSISATAFGATSFKQESGCNGLACYGQNNGGYGNHLSGSSGSGNLAGYSQVRFDGYRPDPGLIPCNTNTPADRRALSSLGLSDSSAPRYIHHRVAILRSDNVTATHGVRDATYWNSGFEYNLNTGVTRAANPNNLDRAPTQASPWIGPHWLGATVCLPLSGGTGILNELANKKPVIKVVSEDSDIAYLKELPAVPPGLTGEEALEFVEQNIGRVFLRMKNLYLQISIEESTSTSAGITIEFEQLVDQIQINVGSLDKFFEYLDNGSDPESARDIWVSGKSKRSPIYVDFARAISSEASVGSTTVTTYKVPIVVKRKGIYSINVDANYNAYVGGNNGATTPFTGLSGTSNSLWVRAISVKSVNRR